MEMYKNKKWKCIKISLIANYAIHCSNKRPIYFRANHLHAVWEMTQSQVKINQSDKHTMDCALFSCFLTTPVEILGRKRVKLKKVCFLLA